ncbi:MAG: hypothetical protein D6814_07395 [Calditrichaeota bacterium]|nr:MAG: hypothetical protein D6814_07395 [Calditrichota bacterium]
MARVRIAEVIEHFDHEMKRALEEAVKRQLPESPIDRNTLYKDFVKAVRSRLRDWENVPNQMVDAD